MTLLRFSGVVVTVEQSLEPHTLCGYLYEVAIALNTFYQDCPVLKAESDAQRDSRLRLVRLTARVLATGLGLLGIEAPERM
jgi:arginyl-tRNA synthetase